MHALPQHVLLAAAVDYLDPLVWDLLPDDWAQTAIAHATTPVAGGLSMLHRSRRLSVTGTDEHAYTLSDYLAHTLTGETGTPPDSVWKALTDTPAVIDQNTLIAAAHRHGRLDAITPPAPTASNPTDSPLIAGARLLHAQGRTDEALSWFERAAAAGHHQAWLEAATVLSGQNRTEEALAWYERAAHAGNTEALSHAASVLAASGRIDEALRWYERAAAYNP
ncbi:tetratricopeptide repeat protein [Streptomyces sp. NBC_01439]|uniref:tetratricopeptide repeat protein n=1 Tax=Streptomyces sp. NBC_01439 TaxID=2903867 RepID=UPI002E2E0C7F|nr:tetratricopeptide repeat protein [Streptomyces sp. NBC_01439]